MSFKNKEKIASSSSSAVTQTTEHYEKENQEVNIKELSKLIDKNAKQIDKNAIQIDKNAKLIEDNTKGIAQLKKDIKESNKRTDKLLARYAIENRKVVKSIDKKLGRFDNRWGLFMESLIFGDIGLLFEKIGIDIPDIKPRQRLQNKEKKTKEFDIVGLGKEYIVLVEIKTSLKTSHIRDFFKKLKEAKSFFPKYPDRKITGAIGYLYSTQLDRNFAMKEGFFVIRTTGSSASIVNPIHFRPKVFG